MTRIMPSLWFDKEAEDAANFYVSIFENSKIVDITRYGSTGPGPEGSVMTVDFELRGQPYNAINGGPVFPFTEAISLLVECDTQQEVDTCWDKLLEGGGQPVQCGWLKDKYGLSWQVVPTALYAMITDPDKERSASVTEAMLQMVKIDAVELQRVYDSA